MRKKDMSIIGMHVKYFDHVGQEHFGKIIALEPNPIDASAPYCYIEDEDSSFNSHLDMVDGRMISYAEIRTSDQVIPD